MTPSIAETDLEAQTKAHSGVKRPLVPPTAPPMHTPSPQPPPGADPQLGVANTNGRHNGNPPAPPTTVNSEVHRDENHGDSSDPLWSMYLTESEKQDKEVTESWKGDTDGILVFTGLFSATVATFIIESLKNLSPDSSKTTNVLLTQISQQLVNISNGTPLTSVVTQSGQPFTPTPSAIRVNVLWFLSLILSLTCALSATLIQQWARRYQELTQRRGATHRRGRMRAYISDGITRFEMARVVATMPTLLHVSVFLFFAGIADFLFPIYPTVAHTTLCCIVTFALAYAILTVLPNIFLNCPYATPLSTITWRISQFSAVIFLQTVLRIRKSFSKIWSLMKRQPPESPGTNRWETVESQVQIRRQWFSQGMRRSVELSAYRADSTVVTNALTWTLTSLDEDKEIEDFAARVPGFFDSHVVPDATSAVLPLMSRQPNTGPVFGSRLYDLLKTCIPEVSILGEEKRKKRLRVCMMCLWSFGNAYDQLGSSLMLPSYFLPEITRCVQAEEDSGVRVIGRCLGALVVNKLAADLVSRADPISDEELAFMSAILGDNRRNVNHLLIQPGAVTLMGMISLMFDEVGTIPPYTVPSDVLGAAQQTLGILSQALQARGSVTLLRLDQPIAIIDGSNGKSERVLLSHLHDLLNTCISAASPLQEEVRTCCLQMCLKGLWYFGRAFNQIWNFVHLPSYTYVTFSNSEVALHLRKHPNLTVRVIGRCVGALIVNKLAADINARTLPVNDEELACLSDILGTDNQDMTLLLSHPGAVQFANIAFLMMDDTYDDDSQSPNAGVLDVVRETFGILSQALPAQSDTEMWLDLTDSLMDVSRGTSKLLDVMRSRVLGMCLKNLWHFTRAHIERGSSISLPSYVFVTFTHPEVTRRIFQEDDTTSCVIGRCVGAFVVNKLVTNIDARTLPVNDAELACLSAILGIDSEDVIPLLDHPGAIQFANIVLFLLLEAIRDPPSWNPTSDVLDMIQQTFSTLSQALPAQLDAPMRLDLTDSLMDVSRGTSSLSHVMRSRVLGVCLENLWHFTRVYIERGSSIPLPSYVIVAFAHPKLTRRLRKGGNIASRVIGSCVGALVVSKLATDFNARTLVNDAELACLSAILCLHNEDVKLLLNHPGAVQFASMIFLMSDNIYDSFWNPTSDALDIVRQTFSILSQALPTHLDASMQLDLTDSLMGVSEGSSSLSNVMNSRVLGIFLTKLWHFTRVHIEHGNSISLPSYAFVALTHPNITRRIHKGGDIAPHVIRRCVGALVVNKLAADINAGTLPVNDAELACLSAVLDIDNQDVTHLLIPPGAIQFANMLFLVSDDVYDSLWTSTLDVLDVVRETFSIISQALPAQMDAEMQVDLTDIFLDVSKGTSSLSQVMRNRVLGMCLKNLWNFTRVYIERGNSIPLPPYVYIAFTHPEITRRILAKGDITTHMTRRCVGALVVNKLAADINSGVLPDNDAELVCLSSILDSESRDVKTCLTQPGIVELVNIASFALGHVDTLKAEDMPPDPSDDVLQQTLSILSQALPIQENDEGRPDQMVALSNISDDRFERTIVSRLHGFLGTCFPGASPLTEEVRTSCLRMFLKTLWHSGKAYHDASDHLPPYFPLLLASPEINHRLQVEQDQVARITGCCFGAFVASKLVDALNLELPISLSGHIHDAELACISAIIGTSLHEDFILPHQLRIINFGNIVSLISAEIDILFTAEGTPATVLDIAQDTLNILANRFIDSAFVPQGLPMEQQRLLDDIYLEVNLPSADRLKDQLVKTLGRLQQILEKLLPAVEPSQDVESQNSSGI